MMRSGQARTGLAVDVVCRRVTRSGGTSEKRLPQVGVAVGAVAGRERMVRPWDVLPSGEV